MKLFDNGKNPKWKYYLKNYASFLIPNLVYQNNYRSLLKKAKHREDYSEILERVDYYNKLNQKVNLENSVSIEQFKLKNMNQKVYFFDSYKYLRFFDPKLRFCHEFGDVTFIPEEPSILKSRPIAEDNQNSVILKLNKVRHFVRVNDQLKFEDKKDQLIFRGKVTYKEQRRKFFEMYFNHPLCDLGDTQTKKINPDEWKVEKTSIYYLLKYKYILALEGIDVASNLKWVMSSNSIAVMPQPTYETWFMEAKLIPNVHYIEIKPDFSDLEERLNYYTQHPEEAQKIITNAKAYVEKFWDKEKEDIIALLVLKKYFEKTNQM
ncbi:MAG: glycosyl transferase family 90 [Psychroflexus maritimus]